MKKFSAILFMAYSAFSSILYSQEFVTGLKNYDWNENRKYIQLGQDDEQLPEIIILTKSLNEYVFEDGNFIFYTVEHQIIRVNSDDAISNNNTIVIPMASTSELLNLKVRTITKEGKVTLSDKSNIREIKNDENNRASRIYAIEGVVKGCDIEYYYLVKRNPDICGGLFFQSDAPVKEAYFQLSTPGHLIFKFKGYNGLPDIKDTLIDDKRIYFVRVMNIPDIQKEIESNYAKSRMRVEYKLAVNLSKSKKEMYTWSDFVQYKYPLLHTLTKDEQKATEKLYKTLDIQENMNVESKVRTIENFIKTNFLIQDVYDEDNSSLSTIIHNKYGNKDGILKLYTDLFRLANAGVQLVITSDREKLPFDGSFESWRFINNYVFYITSTGQYLTPEKANFRYPMIPGEQTYTDGLFLKEVNLGGLESAIPIINFITPLDYKASGQTIDAEISFSKNLEETNLKLTCSLKGYHGVYYQPYYNQIPDDKKQLMLTDIVQDITKDKNYTTLTAENTEPNLCLTEKPFIVHAEVNGSALLEKAGDKLLLKIGELLGPQVEMYQDNKRKLNIEYDYNREYIRKIKVIIPDGYSIKNPDDINISRIYEKDGKNIYYFVSGYSLENNMLLINIEEFYNQIECPLAHFEDYRKVVNAAADFNKVILVFEPK
jgi:hypothetical protein